MTQVEGPRAVLTSTFRRELSRVSQRVLPTWKERGEEGGEGSLQHLPTTQPYNIYIFVDIYI